MLKVFIAFVVCFIASFGISQINTILEWKTLPFGLAAAVVAALFAKLVGTVFGLNKETAGGAPRRDGTKTSLTVTNVGALLAAAFAFLFSILG